MQKLDHISRRDVMKRFGILAVGLAVGCTPLRIVFHAYPEVFDDDPDLLDKVMRSFVATVIPDGPIADPDLARIYTDTFYPFAPHAAYFAADLCRRSRSLFGVDRFDALNLAQRTKIIQHGLAGSAITRRLYNGAVFMAQISFYSGIYDDEKGCPLIGFEGRYRIRPLEELTYPDSETYFAAHSTRDGNYA